MILKRVVVFIQAGKGRRNNAKKIGVRGQNPLTPFKSLKLIPIRACLFSAFHFYERAYQ